MAATITVPHRLPTRISSAGDNASHIIESPIVPRHGVITLWGYGINVSVDKGHLILRDGIGDERRAGRFARVNHGIKRLVIIGADGMVSLAALRWLADQDASFVMLERDGTVLLTTGPIAATDARLRRAQACAESSGVDVPIARELISQKLTGQENVARKALSDAGTCGVIAQFRERLQTAETTQEISFIESKGAAAYWAAWRNCEVRFPKSELPRVPEHWRTFGPRCSPLSGSPRNAANPANAILNYLYAVLESETRLAIAALGLDPGFGVLHVDRSIRDSLACDLMEPIRPTIDAYLLDWLNRTPLKREYFFEQRDGSCRLMGSFAQTLSETALTWRREVAPIVEWFTQTIWSTVPNAAGRRAPGTRLTRRRWREATGIALASTKGAPAPQSLCRNCGASISAGKGHCDRCSETLARENLAKGAQLGRIRALTPEAKAKRGESARLQNAAQQAWDPASLPAWLDNEAYVTRVRPLLERFTRSAIAAALNVRIDYAGEVRAGRRIPHTRHWENLATLVGVSAGKHDGDRD